MECPLKMTYLSKNINAPEAFPAKATLPSAKSTSLSNSAISSEEGWCMVQMTVLP
jgi:hypothetical protein